jgi:hypothetical protein
MRIRAGVLLEWHEGGAETAGAAADGIRAIDELVERFVRFAKGYYHAFEVGASKSVTDLLVGRNRGIYFGPVGGRT